MLLEWTEAFIFQHTMDVQFTQKSEVCRGTLSQLEAYFNHRSLKKNVQENVQHNTCPVKKPGYLKKERNKTTRLQNAFAGLEKSIGSLQEGQEVRQREAEKQRAEEWKEHDLRVLQMQQEHETRTVTNMMGQFMAMMGQFITANQQGSTLSSFPSVRTRSGPALDDNYVRHRLREYGEVLDSKYVSYASQGFTEILTGTRQYRMRLKSHVPNTMRLGNETFSFRYAGQPRLCHRCGREGHQVADCDEDKCSKCMGLGHLAQDCTSGIKCNISQAGGSCTGSKESDTGSVMTVLNIPLEIDNFVRHHRLEEYGQVLDSKYVNYASQGFP
ncbi:ZCCHC3 [Branchiostoma lanceolatum]|uniref:ZCCHC3 protein n=1 Tax=Branchiostoma lanceolatum TaxID=7740 RepID=A0A8K0A5P0_BRALA|nr:ZCCHC3 [Branchiostoma lanceolatum]